MVVGIQADIAGPDYASSQPIGLKSGNGGALSGGQRTYPALPARAPHERREVRGHLGALGRQRRGGVVVAASAWAQQHVQRVHQHLDGAVAQRAPWHLSRTSSRGDQHTGQPFCFRLHEFRDKTLEALPIEALIFPTRMTLPNIP